MKEMSINQGGLMRCCLETLEEIWEQLEKNESIDSINCKFCNESMYRDKNNIWRWTGASFPN
jgi:hypothetical protein